MIEKQLADIIEKGTEMKQFERKLKLEYRLTPQRGHKVFEFNLDTFTISDPIYEGDSTISWENAKAKDFSQKRKIIKKANCIYVSALNKKNAIKKVKKLYEDNK